MSKSHLSLRGSLTALICYVLADSVLCLSVRVTLDDTMTCPAVAVVGGPVGEEGEARLAFVLWRRALSRGGTVSRGEERTRDPALPLLLRGGANLGSQSGNAFRVGSLGELEAKPG